MNTSRAPFLIPGIGYLVLGLATAGLGLLYIASALVAAHAEQASPIQLVPLATFAVIVLLFMLFYFAMAFGILRQQWRLFVLVGACISCILIPFGTVLGVVFLIWTRRQWHAAPVPVE